MTALVTGAGGQLGRALLASAAAAGIEAVGLTRADLDIADEAAWIGVLDAHAPDLVVNAAAYTAVDKAESEADAAFRINRDAPGLLARLCAARGVRLVHVSTDFVFDGTQSSPYLPGQPVAPLGVYGASKAAGEAAVQAALPEALIVRTAWVYAASGANFMLTMLRLMASQPALRVVGDQIGTPTHAASLARAIWSLAGAGATGLHHYTDAGAASWYDFAVAIQEEALALGLLARAIPVAPIRTADYPTPARRPAYSVLDKTDTYAALGTPAAHWRAELRAALHELAALRAAPTNGTRS
ncbi:MAG: dTDP-4-dehydrorhamnose reductase [Alphaproteobacteria bacterium]|nr:dTDP-4-dehydrorhamnose reductase [Alphaproteobacteria bacterium]